MQTSTSGHGVPEGSPYARHLPALDGVRGFAVLGVACSHIFPGATHSAFEALVHDAFSFGARGVDLFFVLSGFLITGILYDSLPDPGFFRKFYARRILRIFPLYYGVLAIFAVAALIFGPTALPLPHFWSLAVEEQFYLVWPITVFLLRTRRRLLIFCAAALVLCPFLRFFLFTHGVNYFIVGANTLCRSDSLLAGAALALLVRSRFHDRILRASGWIFLASAAVGALSLYSAYHGPLLNTPTGFQIYLAFDFSTTAIASVGVIGLSLRSRLASRLCTLGPMRWLGKYSYGIYVLHLIFFSYMEEPMRHFFYSRVTPNKGVGIIATGLLIFLVSITAAYLSYHLYEKHFLRLKRFFDYRPHPDTVS